MVIAETNLLPSCSDVTDLRAEFSMTTETSPNAVRSGVQDLEGEFITERPQRSTVRVKR
jgi:hypothetical protein